MPLFCGVVVLMSHVAISFCGRTPYPRELSRDHVRDFVELFEVSMMEGQHDFAVLVAVIRKLRIQHINPWLVFVEQ
jgi:hypothetical protein